MGTLLSVSVLIAQLVEIVKLLPLPLPYLAPAQRLQNKALLGHPVALAAKVFTLAAAEPAEEVVETAVTAIEPVKLSGAATMHAGLQQQDGIGFLREQQVPG